MAQKKGASVVACAVFCLLFSLLMVGWVMVGAFLLSRGASAPTAEDTDDPPLTVVIDAGHGGEDGGAVGVNGVYEKDINLSLSKKIERILTSCGVRVVMTRREDILLYDKTSDYRGKKKVQDLLTRRRMAEEHPDCVFVSIHMNAFPEEKYRGLQVWYSKNNPKSHALADRIQEESRLRLLPDNHRAPKGADESIYLLHHLSCPAVLVECGFLSNPEECEKLSGEAYQSKLALSLSLSILGFCEEYEKTSQKQLDFSYDLLYNEGVDPKKFVCFTGGNDERRKNSLYLFVL